LCKILNKDAKYLAQVSLLMMKLKFFVKDCILFLPKENNQILNEMKNSSYKSKKQGFTVTEISEFERIIDKLRPSNANQLVEYESTYSYLVNHKC
jgi:hypothetical protein